MAAKVHSDGYRCWPAVAALTLLGLGLRIAASRGAMWTDEAWSVLYAAQAADPVGVFLRINHDNNHHLNTLWLQAIGSHAPSLLARAPAIVAGTLSIPVAALIAGRRSAAAAIAAAALFAISPIMVVYGSEARGYAPMMLAALLMILIAANALERGPTRATPWLLALVAALGVLSHLTVLAPLGLVSAWIFLEKRRSAGLASAIRETLALVGPGILAAGAMVLLVMVPPLLSATGLQTGGYNPHRFSTYCEGLAGMWTWTTGVGLPVNWLAPVVLLLLGFALLIRPPRNMGQRARLYGLLILGVPAVILVERIGNAQFARFYLTSAVGLLLAGAEWAGQAVHGGRTRRALLAVAALLFIGGSAWHDRRYLQLGRGQHERAIQLMAKAWPGGARVDVRIKMFEAPVVVAAGQAHYPLALAKGCAPAEFMIEAHTPDTPQTIMRCGRPMRAIGSSEAIALTGDAWVLYAP